MFRQLEEVNAEKDAVNKMKVELETKLRNLEWVATLFTNISRSLLAFCRCFWDLNLVLYNK